MKCFKEILCDFLIILLCIHKNGSRFTVDHLMQHPMVEHKIVFVTNCGFRVLTGRLIVDNYS